MKRQLQPHEIVLETDERRIDGEIEPMICFYKNIPAGDRYWRMGSVFFREESNAITWKPVNEPPAGLIENKSQTVCRTSGQDVVIQRGTPDQWASVVTHWLLVVPPMTDRITKLVKVNGLVLDQVKALALLAKAGKEMKLVIFGFDVLVFRNGDITVGCQNFLWSEVDGYAREQGFWS